MLGEKVAYPPPLFGLPAPEGKEIVGCEVFENLLILLTRDNSFYYVRNLPNCISFRPELITELNLRQKPLCFKTIPANSSYSSNLEILCGHPDGGLIIVPENDEVKRLVKIPFTNEEISRVIDMALSADGTYLALYGDGGTVVVLHSNLSTFLGRSETGKRDRPL